MGDQTPYKISTAILFIAAWSFGLSLPARPSQHPRSAPSQTDDSMPGMHMGQEQSETPSNADAASAANAAMSGHDMDDMHTAHMYMTALRPTNPDDQKRADAILGALRPAIEKYKDYHVALADGFQIFLANLPQELYHFTNGRYALEAIFTFDPARPTSLLYRKTKDGYELEGAMYTARKLASEDDLNARVPLSVARWHKHTNFCLPPKGTPLKDVDLKEFGLRGSIVTESACEQAGGQWFPQIFGWMVHVYPYETDPAKIWAR
jgi:hypothetical protein